METNPPTPGGSDPDEPREPAPDEPELTADDELRGSPTSRAAQAAREVSSADERDDAAAGGPVDEAREHVRRDDAVDRVREEAKRTRRER
jgi:hypothetical protein